MARDLGMTKAELRRRMSLPEYREWVAFYVFEGKYQDQQREEARRGR